MEPRTTQWLDGKQLDGQRPHDSAGTPRPDHSDLAATRSEVPTVGARNGADTQPSDDAPVVSLGQTLGKYQIRERLGRGGQAQAFLAFDPDLQRDVVIKFYHAAQTPAEGEAVLNEGRALARVRSPFVAQCYGADRHEGVPYLVLEYVPGETLAALASRGRLGSERALRLVGRIAEGLAAIHAGGLLHLDLKPSNILVGADDHPRIVDFGLATTAGSERLRKISGTPAYMAPEQARGEFDAIGPRADVFALGAVLYELLVGRPLYKGESQLSVWNQAKQGDVVWPATVDPTIPAPLDALCRKTLAKNPADRWASADELRRQIEQVERKDSKRIGFGFQWGRFKFQLSLGISLASVLALFAGIAWMDREAAGPGMPTVAFHAPDAPSAPISESTGLGGIGGTEIAAASPMGGVGGSPESPTAADKHEEILRGAQLAEAAASTEDAKSKRTTTPDQLALKHLRRDGQNQLPGIRKSAADRRDFRVSVEPIAPCRFHDGVIEVPHGAKLTVRLQAERDCSAALFWHGSDGKITQLLPNGHEPVAKLVAQEPRVVPGADGRGAAYELPVLAAGAEGQLLLIAKTGPLAEAFAAPTRESARAFRTWSSKAEQAEWQRELVSQLSKVDLKDVADQIGQTSVPVRFIAGPAESQP